MRWGCASTVAAVVLFGVCVARLAIGAKSIPMREVVAALFGQGDGSVRVIIGDWRFRSGSGGSVRWRPAIWTTCWAAGSSAVVNQFRSG